MGAQAAATLAADTAAHVTDGSALDAALKAAFVPKWKAAETVTAGTIQMAPDGTVIERIADGTTGASYDATEQAAWTVKGGGGVADASTTVKGVVELATNTEMLGPASTDTARAVTPAGLKAVIDAALPAGGGSISLDDNGDGTATLSGTAVTDNGDGTATIAA